MDKTKILKICDEIENEVKELRAMVLNYKVVTKPNDCPLNIKGAFFAKDRLNELDEVPKLPNGETDYWLAGKLLCEKDGGRLPTPEELGKLGEWLYSDKNGIHPTIGAKDDAYVSDYEFDVEKANSINLKNWYGSEITEDYVSVGLWSSVQGDSDYAYGRNFSTDYAYWDAINRRYTGRQVLCLG